MRSYRGLAEQPISRIEFFVDAVVTAIFIVTWIARHSPECELHALQCCCLGDVGGADRDAIVFAGTATYRCVESHEHFRYLDRKTEAGGLSHVRFETIDRFGKDKMTAKHRILDSHQRHADSRLLGTFGFFALATCKELFKSACRQRLGVTEQSRR